MANQFIYAITDTSYNSFKGSIAVNRRNPTETIKKFRSHSKSKTLLRKFIQNKFRLTGPINYTYASRFDENIPISPVENWTDDRNYPNTIDHSSIQFGESRPVKVNVLSNEPSSPVESPSDESSPQEVSSSHDDVNTVSETEYQIEHHMECSEGQ